MGPASAEYTCTRQSSTKNEAMATTTDDACFQYLALYTPNQPQVSSGG